MSKNRTAVKPMTLKQYRQVLHEYDDSYLQCKDIRHSWQIDSPYHRTPEGWVIRVLSCTRCGTVRTDTFAVTGGNRLARVSNSYRYPAGFSIRGLPKAENLSEVTRHESYLRAMQQLNRESA